MTAPLRAYCELVASRLSQAAAEDSANNAKLKAWQKRVEQLTGSNLAANFAGCGRRLGTQAVVLSQEEHSQLQEANLPQPDGWTLAMVGRIALLGVVSESLPPDELRILLTRLYRTADSEEKIAILRALPGLPEPGRFKDLAVDACRSHVQSVFEAIACENPYAAEFFPEANFHQLVLKAFFTEIETSRIVNLPQRRSDELTRMAEGYASERRAAGRLVPPDLGYVTGSPRKTDN